MFDKVDAEYAVPFSAKMLPKGFRYPDGYLKMVQDMPCGSYYPWFLLSSNWKSSRGIIRRIKKWFGVIAVPFASLELGDGDLVAFDGTDDTGDPAVFSIVFDDSRRSYGYDNFDAWQKQAQEDSVHFKENGTIKWSPRVVQPKGQFRE